MLSEAWLSVPLRAVTRVPQWAGLLRARASVLCLAGDTRVFTCVNSIFSLPGTMNLEEARAVSEWSLLGPQHLEQGLAQEISAEGGKDDSPSSQALR